MRSKLTVVLALTFLIAACADEPPAGDLEAGAPGTDETAGAPDDDDDAGTGDDDGDDAGGDDEDREADGGGELVFALPDEPDVLDPTLGRSLVGNMVFTNMCEGLYEANEDLEVVPLLAADLPTFSDDGLTVTIGLRDDAVFHDGTPMDAEAVATSLERHRTMDGSARSGEIAQVEETVAVDDHTVEIRLSEPFVPLTATLADRAGIIMSPTQIDELGDDFGDDPVCVGPFAFVERGNDQIRLERAEHYYDADEVRLDEVVFTSINDGNVRTSQLRSGDIHMAERVPATDVAQIESDPDLELHEATSTGWWGLQSNVGNVDGMDEAPGEPDTPLAEDPRVREALELSLDRAAINEAVFNGLFIEACTPLSPATPWAPEVECPERDTERAQELLVEAGYDLPVSVTLLARPDDENARLAQLVQSMASEGGFDMEVSTVEFVTGQDMAIEGDFELYHSGWSGRVDPDGNLYAFNHTDGSFNYAGLSDPDIDALLEDGRALQDDDERQEAYDEVIDRLRDERNYIYLYYPTLFVGASSDIDGFEFHGDWLPRLKTAGFR